MTQVREIRKILQGTRVSDGAGVSLTRLIGTPELNMLDPFLLFDAFGSDHPQEYIAGFPPHPHRGFETVTYMLKGRMRHEDSGGNCGIIEQGGVQWMTAGRGVIHSEMPEQNEGTLAGFQLWINLPADKKMGDPQYQEYDAATLPVEVRPDGVHIKVIAGTTETGKQGVIENAYIVPTYFHVTAPSETTFLQSVLEQNNSFVYVLKGHIIVGDKQKSLKAGQLAVLENGHSIIIRAESQSEYLVVSGKPLNEPVVRGGPFVMNTREEVEQAFKDYREGTFVNDKTYHHKV